MRIVRIVQEFASHFTTKAGPLIYVFRNFKGTDQNTLYLITTKFLTVDTDKSEVLVVEVENRD